VEALGMAVSWIFRCGYGVGIKKPRWMRTEVINLLVSLAEGARFETPEALETIRPDCPASVLSQALLKAGS